MSSAATKLEIGTWLCAHKQIQKIVIQFYMIGYEVIMRRIVSNTPTLRSSGQTLQLLDHLCVAKWIVCKHYECCPFNVITGGRDEIKGLPNSWLSASNRHWVPLLSHALSASAYISNASRILFEIYDVLGNNNLTPCVKLIVWHFVGL